jgi:phosphoenolpyruvate carboxykinase (ATP)
VFGIEVPAAVPGVPAELLTPRSTWADAAAYDAQARKLATMFRENFEQYRSAVPDDVAKAGPRT